MCSERRIGTVGWCTGGTVCPHGGGKSKIGIRRQPDGRVERDARRW